MNQKPRDRLYKLLPAIYQLRDGAEGEPLRALLAVIEQEVQTIEEDIGDLYDNWFIETCAEWVIPYIGDLLDVRELYASSFPATQPQNQLLTTEKELLEPRPPSPRPYGQQERRAYVANTLAYRRRKGTTPDKQANIRDVIPSTLASPTHLCCVDRLLFKWSPNQLKRSIVAQIDRCANRTEMI